MHRQDGDVALVFPIERVEVGQFLYTGGAVGGPEIEEDDLAAGVREVELAAVKALQREVRELLSDV